MKKLLLRQMAKAIMQYDMIQDGDCIAVGLSGGKDSLALLYALAGIRNKPGRSFTLTAINVSMDRTCSHKEYLADICSNLQVEFRIMPSDIKELVFEDRKEKNPCSLCANLRRGMLVSEAKRAGCNKLALGHNKDDAIETMLMSMYFEGRLHSFAPCAYMSRRDITVIRPLIYSWEHEIELYNKQLGLKAIKQDCPAAGNTNRQRIKLHIEEETKINPDFKQKLFRVLTQDNISGWKEVES